LKVYFDDILHIPTLDPQSAIFGFLQVDPNFILVLNHILLIFKYYVYITRDSHKLSLTALIKALKKVYVLEKKFSANSVKKTKRFHKKWSKLELLFS